MSAPSPSGRTRPRHGRFQVPGAAALFAVGMMLLSASLPARASGQHPSMPLSPFPGPLNTTRLPRGPYAVKILHNRMVPMSDGIRLATDVYLPVKRGKWPAILVRTPYGKRFNADRGRFFASHGYVYVVQDVRGVYESEGTFNPYVNDPADGLQTAQWITRQPWFNAHEGLALEGGSYMAATAIDTALENPPDLRAAYIYIASANYHDDGGCRDGAVRLKHDVGYANALCAEIVPRRVRPGSPLRAANPFANLSPAKIWAEDRQTPLDIGRLSATCPWYNDWVSNENQNWYWNQPGFDHVPLLSRWPHVPTEFLGDYYGLFLGGTIIDYTAARRALRRDPRAPVALTLGPWTHGASESAMAGSGYFGPHAIVNPYLQALAWFDHYLKGIDNGVNRQPRVRYFVMGGGSGAIAPFAGPPNPGEGGEKIDILGHWLSARRYPPPGTKVLPLFVGPRDTLSATPSGASSHRPARAGRYVFRYNPLHPSPTLGGNFIFGQGVAPNGAQNQTCQPSILDCDGSRQALDQRADTIALRSPVLATPVTIAGHVRVTLYASSSAPDTDFTAKLLDDYPNGTQINVASGIIDAKYRNGLAQPRRLVPGHIYKLTIDLLETGQIFEPGHRIELDISSSNFPDFNRNMDVYQNVALQTAAEAISATQTVYFGGQTPSHVDLPVSPGSRANFMRIKP